MRRFVRLGVVTASAVLLAPVLPLAASATPAVPSPPPTRSSTASALVAGAAPSTGTLNPSAISRAATAVVIDDRALVRGLIRRAVVWRSVTSTRASKRTLTVSARAGANLRARSVARNGGAVLVQAGPLRGTVEVRVAGKRKVLASTAARRVAAKWIVFRGAGVVDIRVVTPGRAGVWIDALKLNPPPAPPAPPPRRRHPHRRRPPPAGPARATRTAGVAPGSDPQLNLGTTGQGANAEIMNAAVSPDGTKVAYWSKATNLVPGVTDGWPHLYVAQRGDRSGHRGGRR